MALELSYICLYIKYICVVERKAEFSAEKPYIALQTFINNC